jgi:hypothetical protein
MGCTTAYLLQQIQLLPHQDRHGLPPWSKHVAINLLISILEENCLATISALGQW